MLSSTQLANFYSNKINVSVTHLNDGEHYLVKTINGNALDVYLYSVASRDSRLLLSLPNLPNGRILPVQIEEQLFVYFDTFRGPLSVYRAVLNEPSSTLMLQAEYDSLSLTLVDDISQSGMLMLSSDNQLFQFDPVLNQLSALNLSVLDGFDIPSWHIQSRSGALNPVLTKTDSEIELHLLNQQGQTVNRYSLPLALNQNDDFVELEKISDRYILINTYRLDNEPLNHVYVLDLQTGTSLPFLNGLERWQRFFYHGFAQEGRLVFSAEADGITTLYHAALDGQDRTPLYTIGVVPDAVDYYWGVNIHTGCDGRPVPGSFNPCQAD